MKLKSQKGHSSISIEGTNYEVGEDGLVEVEDHHGHELIASHGFIAAPVAEEAPPAKRRAGKLKEALDDQKKQDAAE